MAKSVGMFQRPVEYKLKNKHEVLLAIIDYESVTTVGLTISGTGELIEIRCSETSPPVKGNAVYIYYINVETFKLKQTLMMKGELHHLENGYWSIGFDYYSKNDSIERLYKTEVVSESFSCNMTQPWAFIDSIRSSKGKPYPTNEDYVNAETSMKSYFVSKNPKLDINKYISML